MSSEALLNLLKRNDFDLETKRCCLNSKSQKGEFCEGCRCLKLKQTGIMRAVK
jgi:hypothetical protein